MNSSGRPPAAGPRGAASGGAAMPSGDLELPGWADLPGDVLLAVYAHLQALGGDCVAAGLACKSWARALGAHAWHIELELSTTGHQGQLRAFARWASRRHVTRLLLCLREGEAHLGRDCWPTVSLGPLAAVPGLSELCLKEVRQESCWGPPCWRWATLGRLTSLQALTLAAVGKYRYRYCDEEADELCDCAYDANRDHDGHGRAELYDALALLPRLEHLDMLGPHGTFYQARLILFHSLSWAIPRQPLAPCWRSLTQLTSLLLGCLGSVPWDVPLGLPLLRRLSMYAAQSEGGEEEEARSNPDRLCLGPGVPWRHLSKLELQNILVDGAFGGLSQSLVELHIGESYAESLSELQRLTQLTLSAGQVGLQGLDLHQLRSLRVLRLCTGCLRDAACIGALARITELQVEINPLGFYNVYFDEEVGRVEEAGTAVIQAAGGLPRLRLLVLTLPARYLQLPDGEKGKRAEVGQAEAALRGRGCRVVRRGPHAERAVRVKEWDWEAGTYFFDAYP